MIITWFALITGLVGFLAIFLRSTDSTCIACHYSEMAFGFVLSAFGALLSCRSV